MSGLANRILIGPSLSFGKLPTVELGITPKIRQNKDVKSIVDIEEK
jgi:hypothetical protein